jgi:hypothetical protein
MKIRIFYAGMLLEEFSTTATLNTFSKWRKECSNEIYNGAYIFSERESPTNWFRMDLTPCQLSDVPKELQLLNLIL